TTEECRHSELIAAGKEDPGCLLEAAQPAAFLAIAPRVEIHDRYTRGADIAEQLFVSWTGLVQTTGCRDHDDVGGLAPRDAHETLENAGVVFLVLRTANWNDPTPFVT